MLCFLSWIAVDAYDDGDNYGDDDNDNASIVYATDYSITIIYLLIYHPP
jgi:hypothetical protein